MKYIFSRDQTISAITSTAEDEDYLVENLLTSDIKDIWKGLTNTATLTATVDLTSDAFGLYGTNAESATVTVKNVAESVTYYGPTAFDLKTDKNILIGNFFADYGTQSVDVHVIVALTAAAGTVIQAGVADGGLLSDYANSTYDLKEGRDKRSIVKKLLDQTLYVKKLDTARRYRGVVFLERDEDSFYDFTRNMDLQGMVPMSCLVTDLNEIDWALWGHLDMDDSSHNSFSHSQVTFTILEAAQTVTE